MFQLDQQHLLPVEYREKEKDLVHTYTYAHLMILILYSELNPWL